MTEVSVETCITDLKVLSLSLKNIIENLTFGEETCRKTKRLLIFYKSEVSFIWRDLGTKYSRIKGKNPHN